MRWGLGRLRWCADARQRGLPFWERSERRVRLFKRWIGALTALAVVGLLTGTSVGRFAVGSLTGRARQAAMRQIGLGPDRSEVEALLRVRRVRTLDRTRASLTNYYRGAGPAMQRLFRVAGMDPDHCVIGTGRAGDGFLLSSRVFAAADNGRSYRLLPGRRSVWLRQITLHGGPFGLFLVPDDPEVREAAAAAGAVVDEPSRQTTNSWGLRGPEPDPSATVRGVVLGDSFMQGMFSGDNDTPPLALQRALADLWGVPVSVLNTGHIGYAPEQYHASLREYGARFRPHFVVVSVCPNDFGPGEEVMAGRGDDWAEAKHRLGEIVAWCRGHTVPIVLAPVPCDIQIIGARKDGHYPAPISDLFEGSGRSYYNALDLFIDEHLRLTRELERRGKPWANSPLYNGHIADNHFSPAGSALWAKTIARRLDLLMQRRRPEASEPDGASP